MKRLLLLGAIFVAACVSRPPGNEVSDFFKRYDRNHDGVISYAEAQVDQDLLLVFERADANHDGVLDRREFDEAAVLAARNRRAGAAAGWGGSAPPPGR